MKTVLFVTSFFPPRVNVGTIRTVKFLKYLAHFDWRAVVICPHEIAEKTDIADDLLAQMGPHVTVSHVHRDPFLYTLDRGNKNKMVRFAGYLMNNILPPDGHIFWALRVLPYLRKEIERYKPDIVYTTCSPFSINIVGAWIKFRYKLPWVTDFRDLWTLNPISKGILKLYYKSMSGILEKGYLKHCDALIVTTENSKKRIIGKYPFLHDKTWVIPNGYDPDDVPEEEEIPLRNSFLYSGSIYKDTYTPLPMLRLLSKLMSDGFFKTPVELHYAGSDGDALDNLVQQAGINATSRKYGYLDQKNLYKLIKRTEYILLCMPQTVDTQSWIPARLYDYIGNKSNIICVAQRDSEIAQILKEYKRALLLYYEEHEDVQAGKLTAFLTEQKGEGTSSDKLIDNFSRRELTGKLARALNSFCGRKRSGAADK